MALSICFLPPELVRMISDHLIGIKEWAADTTYPPAETREFDSSTGSDWEQPTTLASRLVDFVGLRTLPSLAVASRCFLEPALDALWDTLPGYNVLVYILSRDAWAAETQVNYSGDRGPSFQYIVRIVFQVPKIVTTLTSIPLSQ